jgi:hypothetical protein
MANGKSAGGRDHMARQEVRKVEKCQAHLQQPALLGLTHYEISTDLF